MKNEWVSSSPRASGEEEPRAGVRAKRVPAADAPAALISPWLKTKQEESAAPLGELCSLSLEKGQSEFGVFMHQVPLSRN